jgi:photosystem II stability/assembly factor-like uncharacterized protein
MKKLYLILTITLLNQHFSFGQNQWQWLNPHPSGYANLQIAFADLMTGYILNSNGDLIKTADQGNSWTIVNNFPGLGFGSYIAIADSTGVIAGNNGALYISHDNGTTWPIAQPDTADAFRFVNIVSRDSFFLSTAAGNIYATGDRGKTWVRHTTPTQLSCITFLNSRLGFAGSPGSSILKTVDGGNSWTILNQVNYFPSTISAINFLNPDTGYAFRQWDTLLVTHDGGSTWTGHAVYLPDPPNAISFLNDTLGFLCGSTGSLYRSTDGGVTWTYTGAENNFSDGHDLNALSFLSPAIGFTVGNLGQIWKTSDGGQTWIAYAPTYSPVTEASFGSPSTGYAANGTQIRKTTDSGQTWQALPASINSYSLPNTTYKFIHFTSADSGFVVTDQPVLIYKTNDGGQTWDTLYPGGYSYQNATGVSYRGGDTAILCLGQAIYQTVDGGSTWTNLWTPSVSQYGPINLVSIFYVNSTTWYGAYSGQILKTTNGGQYWSTVFGGSQYTNNYNVTGLWFFDDQHGFVSDDEGDIFETTNGGSSWQQVRQYDADDEGNFNSALYFFNSQVGYMTNGSTFGGGSYGRIYKTFDGGQTWHLSHTTGGVTINLMPDSNVVVAGYAGSILRAPIAGVEVDSFQLSSISSCGVTLSATIGIALGEADSIRFLVTAPNGAVTAANATPSSIQDNSGTCTATLNQLTAGETYSAQLAYRYNGIDGYSNTIQFIAQTIPTPVIYDSAGFLLSTASSGNQWYLDAKPIAGATNRVLQPKSSGSYTVQATRDSCVSAMSNPVNFHAAALGVIVAPNPAYDNLTLINAQDRSLTIRIIDLTGQTLLTIYTTNNYINLDVARLVTGEYILNVTDNNTHQTGNLLFIKL